MLGKIDPLADQHVGSVSPRLRVNQLIFSQKSVASFYDKNLLEVYLSTI